ncbi:DUF1972 domain-containing protein [Blastococcus sp. PRF04-17]|uniref:DUF1972 domain-containing protein n=1 Tax=Blastococcus sp. PRF04-17 TaxID=2933797 RepID=UPI001FF3E80C|nr:DUF1972 domain-containing protein [Blastococcus sp. PRF04-17]UOX99773.1 DUF1972 domain-containing protein [Blastococcus sp. PRF04-17]
MPARYGGFETAVEEVGRRLVTRGHDVVVYCRSTPGQADGPDEHLGMRLVHLPAARRRSLETLSHTALSVGHLLGHRTDAAIVFNAANAPLLPLMRLARIPVATHVDGLEWKRAKWGPVGRRYYRMAECMAVRWSDALIADAVGIADYYQREFDAPTTLLTYGAPLIAPGSDRLAELGLEPGGYHLVVARFEPENHVDVIVDGYRRSGARKPLVVVGSAPYSDEYTGRVRALADHRVRFLGGSGTSDSSISCTPTPTPTCTATRWAVPIPPSSALSVRERRCWPTTSTSTARWSRIRATSSPTLRTSPPW